MDSGSELKPPTYSFPRRRKLVWYLVGWVAVSALALVAVLVVYRPAHSAGSNGPHAAPLASLPPGPTGRQPTVGGSAGWALDLFYTPVEKYHHGPLIAVSGCPRAACTGRPVALGKYPSRFLTAVRAQGSGMITCGKRTGRYLSWSETAGYWLDTAPRDAGLRPLRQFASASSATPLLSLQTPIRVLACGNGSRSGTRSICARLRAANWQVVEVSTPHPDRSIRLYVGKETGPHFAAGPWVGRFDRAVLRVG